MSGVMSCVSMIIIYCYVTFLLCSGLPDSVTSALQELRKPSRILSSIYSCLNGPQIPPTMVCGGPTSRSFTSPGKLTMTVPSTPKKAHGTKPVFSMCTWEIDSATFVGVQVWLEGTVIGQWWSVASTKVMVTAGSAWCRTSIG